jgi:signal transduction histidine kinase/Tfp pilus assembly protein PilF
MKELIKHSLLLVTSLTGLFYCQNIDYHNPRLEAVKQIETLLSEASALSGTSLPKAEQKATAALTFSQKTKNLKKAVDSRLLLGHIATLKGENDKALELFNKALTNANQINYRRGICVAIIEIGDIYHKWGQFRKAQDFFEKAQNIAVTDHFKKEEAMVLNCIGKYYHVTGDFEKMIACYQKALSISRSLGDDRQIATVLNNTGKYYISVGNLNMALQSCLVAYKTCERFDDKMIYADVCNHLGGLYLLIDQPDKSLEYHRKALKYRNMISNPEGIAKSLNNFGKVYFDKKQYDSASYYFNQSLDLCRKTGYHKGTVKSLTNMGKVYVALQNPDKAKDVLQQALDLSRGSGYDVGVAEASLALGDLSRQTKNWDAAISHYLSSLEEIRNSNLYELLRDDYSGLYLCYRQKGEIEKALQYHVLLADMDKVLLNVENNRQLAILNISFDSERREKDNQVLRKDNELKEMTIKRKSAFLLLFVVALSFTLLMCIFIYGRFYHKRKANLILEELNRKIVRQNSDLEKLNKELEAANGEKDKIFSIIAHELRNPLYWFQSLAEVLSRNYQTMSPEKIKKNLSALDESAKNAFHLMDNLLQWSRSRLKRITPKKGNHLLASLITETTRMYDSILQQKEMELYIRVPGNASVFADADLFHCILRNLISNAIKYTPSHGTINIQGIEGDTCFTVSVSDSGQGIPGENPEKIFDDNDYFSSPGLMQEKGSGLGLKLCHEFVSLNGGSIWVNSVPDEGTIFSFTVPKSREAKKTINHKFQNVNF